MPSYNKFLVMGNLTRQPETKTLPGGTTVCEFGIAQNRKFRTQGGEEREEVNFFDCQAWGRAGETIQQYFTKGKPIFIDGRMKYDSWESPDGGKRSKLVVVVETFQFVGGRDGGDGSGHGEEDQTQTHRPRQQRRPAASSMQQRESQFGDEQHFKDDDIPFTAPIA